jgi:hypothetical protein
MGRSKAPEDRVADFLSGVPKFDEVKSAVMAGRVTADEAKNLRPGDSFKKVRRAYKNNTEDVVHKRAGLKDE